MSPPSRDPLLAAGVAVAVALAQVPAVVPDGTELAAAGRCLWTVALDPGACAGREPFFWAPAFPLLSGLLALVLDPAVAAHTAAALVVGLLVLPLAALGRRLDVPAAGPVAAALVVATPALRQLVSLPSGRGLALLGLLGAAAVATGPAREGWRRAAGVGALLGLAVLARREAALPAGLLGLFVLVRSWREGAVAAGVVLALAAPWAGLVSLAAGAPRLSSRGWEATTYPWGAVLPHDWLLMEISMGSWGAPLRAALSRAGGGAGAAGLDPAALPAWLRYALPASVPLWLLALGLGGGLGLARGPRGRRALLGLFALGLPPLLLAAVPNARSVVHPDQNLHPTVIAVLIPAMAGLAALGGALARRLPRPAVGLGLGTALAGLSLANQAWVERVVPVGAEPDRVLAAAAALAEGTGPVAATIDSAPAVLRSGRPRLRLASPWLLDPWLAGQGEGLTVLLTHRDLPGAGRTLDRLQAARPLRVAWVVQDGPAWAVAFQVGPASEPGTPQPPGG